MVANRSEPELCSSKARESADQFAAVLGFAAAQAWDNQKGEKATWQEGKEAALKAAELITDDIPESEQTIRSRVAADILGLQKAARGHTRSTKQGHPVIQVEDIIERLGDVAFGCAELTQVKEASAEGSQGIAGEGTSRRAKWR